MKCYSKPIVEHHEVPLADAGHLEEIVAHWTKKERFIKRRTTALLETRQAAHNRTKPSQSSNHCYVLSIVAPNEAYSATKLAEILGLVKAQGDKIKGHEVYRLAKFNPKTYLGSGIATDIAARAAEVGADMLVLDADLTPSQMRNLENLIGLAICDREAVILNVFLAHAKTPQARSQVEIAQLEYLRPRIRGLGLNMDQQAGGIMGSRGPGETASELLARRLDKRMEQLQKGLKKFTQAGNNQRKERANCRRIALLGYTNAGKTSLMNALTQAGLSARDLPFETLDTTTRRLNQDNDLDSSEDILLSDTVGFIRHLPDRLLSSFESTLAEIQESNLLLIVLDASDPEQELHLKTTEKILIKLQVQKLPRFYVFNKIDQLIHIPADEYFQRLSQGHPFMRLSCHDIRAVKRLKATLIERVREARQTIHLSVPYSASAVISQIYAKCKIIDTQSEQGGLRFVLQGTAKDIARIKQSHAEMQK